MRSARPAMTTVAGLDRLTQIFNFLTYSLALHSEAPVGSFRASSTCCYAIGSASDVPLTIKGSRPMSIYPSLELEPPNWIRTPRVMYSRLQKKAARSIQAGEEPQRCDTGWGFRQTSPPVKRQRSVITAPKVSLGGDGAS